MMFRQLPLSEIIAGCRQHTERFQRGEASDSRFCLELWRRALDLRDTEAWCGVIDQYSPSVRRRVQYRTILDEATVAEVVQQTFVTVWLKSHTGAFSIQGRSLAEVLQYLLNSARYALIAVRRQHHDSVPLEDVTDPGVLSADSMADLDVRIDNATLLAHIRREVTANEWKVLQLRYAENLPPREIAALVGISVDQVYGMLADVKRRLRGKSTIRQWRS
jgi:RNA polymerase sigma factor (sigma-70 family)